MYVDICNSKYININIRPLGNIMRKGWNMDRLTYFLINSSILLLQAYFKIFSRTIISNKLTDAQDILKNKYIKVNLYRDTMKLVSLKRIFNKRYVACRIALNNSDVSIGNIYKYMNIYIYISKIKIYYKPTDMYQQ